MHDHISIVEHQPAFLRLSLDAAFFLVFLLRHLQDAFRKRVQHAIAGAIADHEIISKRCDILNIEKQDVFALLVLQGGNDFMCKFKCVQRSPLISTTESSAGDIPGCRPQWLISLNGAEDNRV